MEERFSDSLFFSHGADISSLQKTVKRGKAMKNIIYTCSCCNIHIDDLVWQNLLPSVDHKTLHRVHLPFSYHQVIDQHLLNRLINEQSEAERVLPHLRLLPLASSHIQLSDTGVNNSTHDPLHMDAKQQHCGLLEKELAIWDVLPAGCFKRSCVSSYIKFCSLRLCASLFKKYIISKQPQWCYDSTEKGTHILLHLENRSSEAMVWHVLWRQLELD